MLTHWLCRGFHLTKDEVVRIYGMNKDGSVPESFFKNKEFDSANAGDDYHAGVIEKVGLNFVSFEFKKDKIFDNEKIIKAMKQFSKTEKDLCIFEIIQNDEDDE